MARGTIRPTAAEEAVKRARSIAGGKLLPIPGTAPKGTTAHPLRYRLKAGHNGGKDPYAAHPGMVSYNDHYTADCIGFVAWCLGLDRYQPLKFPHYEGWINTDSMLSDAKGKATYFKFIGVPKPGDVVVFGSTWGLLGRRPGHIGIVTSVPEGWSPEDYDVPANASNKEKAALRKAHWARVGVIDCSPRHEKVHGYAVEEDNAGIWAARGSFVRYVKATP